MILTPEALAEARSTLAALLPQKGTLRRTSGTVSCKIRQQGSFTPLGFAPFLSTSRYEVTFPYGSGVIVGDVLVVPDFGTFHLTASVSDATSTQLKDVLFAWLEGSYALQLVENATVDFVQQGSQRRILGVPVTIEPLSPEEQAAPYALGSTFRVIWADRYAFPDTTSKPGTGDVIKHEVFRNGSGLLQRPQRYLYPLAYATSLIRDV